MGGAALTLVGMQVQFASLLSKMSVPWPNEWRRFLYIAEIFNLNPTQFFGQFDGWPVVNFRTLFIVVANVLPLFISLVMLLVFRPMLHVSWFVLTASAFVVVCVGLFMKLEKGLPLGVWLSGIAAFVLLMCLAVGGAYWVNSSSLSEGRAEHFEEMRRKHEQYKRRKLAANCTKSLLLFCLFSFCLLFFLLSRGYLVEYGLSSREVEMFEGIGALCLVVAVFVGPYCFLTLSRWGRMKIYRLGRFCKNNLLMVLLLIISVTYVPIITYCLSSFLCVDYNCPQGTKFNPLANRSADSWDRSESLFCDPCVFLNGRCRTSEAQMESLSAELCPSFSDRRVWKSPESTCTDSSTKFFNASASLTLFTYLLLLPLLYYRLIAGLTEAVMEGAQVIPLNGENVEYMPPVRLYERQVAAAEPVAASLYQPFKLKWKYFYILTLMFEVVVVVLSNIVAPFAAIAAVAVLAALHFCALAAMIIARPFIITVEQRLSEAVSFCNALNVLYAMLLWFEVGLPGYIAYFVLIVNIITPVICAFVGMRFVKDRMKEANKKKYSYATAKEHVRKRGQIVDVQLANNDLDKPLILITELQPADPIEEVIDLTKLVGKKHRPSLMVTHNPQRHVQLPGPPPEPKELTEHEKEGILMANFELTEGLNQETATVVTQYAMGIAILLLIAGGCSVLGYVEADASQFVEGSSWYRRGYGDVLGGYRSWANFTDSCCCLRSVHQIGRAHV